MQFVASYAHNIIRGFFSYGGTCVPAATDCLQPALSAAIAATELQHWKRPWYYYEHTVDFGP